jgi:ATP-dependent exoDNAse (exonuclease V) beta subunit
VEFLLPWPPNSVGPAGDYLHGFIDCLYQDPQGRWRLLDYKTSPAPGGDVEQLAKRYELQMLVYSLACEQALDAPLAECVLVALADGAEHCCRWDAASRNEGMNRITGAMESLASGT